jgi:hypothetical protein
MSIKYIYSLSMNSSNAGLMVLSSPLVEVVELLNICGK